MEVKNQTADRQMTITRLLQAPRDLVWQAFTHPKHIAAWWGPKGFTNPLCNWDALPGNSILIHMQDPDGNIHPMDGRFVEMVKPEKLVFICAALDENGNRLFEILNTLTFSEKGSHTEMTLHAAISKINPAGEKHLSGMHQGWNQSIDKLDDYLYLQNRELIFERIIDAPQKTVFDAFADPDQLAKWWGPAGFTLSIHNRELKPGGIWRFVMHGPDGRDYQNKVRFLEIEEPTRLVFQHVNDTEIQDVSHQTTVLFEKLGSKTKLSMTLLFASAAELQRVSRTYGAIEGGLQTLARLAALLESTANNAS